MHKRWSIFIDIEGFSFLHKTSEIEAHRRLNNLIKDIYQIGTQIFPGYPNRLFAHQLGDGFVIVSSFPEKTLYRPISIALALMKSALLSGGISKCGISVGDFADIQGTWPDEIREKANDGPTIHLGRGLMTLFTVMGDALINSNKALEEARKEFGSGPLFIIDKRVTNLVPEEIMISDSSDKLHLVNWLENSTKLSNKILESLGYENVVSKQLKSMLGTYIQENELSSEWVYNAQKLMGDK